MLLIVFLCSCWEKFPILPVRKLVNNNNRDKNSNKNLTEVLTSPFYPKVNTFWLQWSITLQPSYNAAPHLTIQNELLISLLRQEAYDKPKGSSTVTDWTAVSPAFKRRKKEERDKKIQRSLTMQRETTCQFYRVHCQIKSTDGKDTISAQIYL